LTLNNLRLGRWVIQDEGVALVMRDTANPGDARYAMWTNTYRDL
jgi:hypothetical protein